MICYNSMLVNKEMKSGIHESLKIKSVIMFSIMFSNYIHVIFLFVSFDK